jgi:hypothetical protein
MQPGTTAAPADEGSKALSLLKEFYDLRSGPGGLAMFAAIRRHDRLSNLGLSRKALVFLRTTG